ncbi:XRE family transcriptional regulator [Aliarcobacter butzleri]
MELNKLINKIHKLIEAKEIKTISQPNMAKRIGVSSRTYIEYSRGTNKPLGMKALLNMLNELEDEEIVKVIRLWKETNNDKTSQDRDILEESCSQEQNKEEKSIKKYPSKREK